MLTTFGILEILYCTVQFESSFLQTTIDPQYVFSPQKAPWRYERDVLREHWPLNEQEFWPGKSYDYQGYVDVIAAGKMDPERGRPNMLNLNYLYELDRINKVINAKHVQLVKELPKVSGFQSVVP